MLLNKRKIIAIFFFLPLLVMGVWFALYEYSVMWLESSVEEFAQDLRKQGFEISYDKAKISGTPFEITASLDNIQIKDPKKEFIWATKEILVSANPFDFYTLTYSLPEDLSVRLLTKTFLNQDSIHFEKINGTLNLTRKGRLEKGSLDVDRITLKKDNKPYAVFAHTLSFSLLFKEGLLNSLLDFKGNIIALESLIGLPPLDHPLTLEGSVELSGYQKKGTPKTLAEWRDGGGVLDVHKLILSWPPVYVEGNGTLTLDKKMYPLGSFTTRIEGHDEAIDYLVSFGVVKKKNATGVSFVLNLFTAKDDFGGRKLTIPITLQNKKLSVGPAPLLKLSPIPEF